MHAIHSNIDYPSDSVNPQNQALVQMRAACSSNIVNIRMFKGKGLSADDELHAILIPRKGVFNLETLEYREWGKVYADGLAYLHKRNDQGYGVYFIPNPGGASDADITEWSCLYYEHDKLTIEEQLIQKAELEEALGKPCTGGWKTSKSVHTYLKLAEPCAVAEGKALQERLIARQGSDGSIRNASRCMRLAGFNHVSWNEAGELVEVPVEVVSFNPESIFTIAELDAILPQLPSPHQCTAVARAQPQQSVVSRTGYRPITSPSDFRGFAHLMPGYDDKGEWLVFQCPVAKHTGDGGIHRTDHIHVRRDSGAWKTHCACSNKDIIKSSLSVAKEKGYKFTPQVASWTDRQHTITTEEKLMSATPERIADLLRYKLMGIRGNKGTGKTEFAKSVVDTVRAGDPNNWVIAPTPKVVAVCHRISLHQALSVRLNLQSDDVSLCLDSLHPNSAKKFKAEDYPGALVIIDECCQVLGHLLSGTTDIRRNRSTVAAELVKLLRSASHVLILDADLDQQTMNLFRNLMGLDIKQTVVLHNQAFAMGVYSFACHTKQEAVVMRAMDECRGGGHIYFACTAQDASSKYSAQTLEALFSKKFPDKRFLVVDSVTIHDQNHPAYNCPETINALVTQYDGVFATPTIGTGISIDVDWFTGVYGIFNGCTSTNTARQALARVRKSVPRHIYASAVGLNPQAGGALTLDDVWTSNERACQRVLGQLTQMGGLCSGLNIVDSGEGLGFLFTEAWANLAIQSNIERLHYRETLLAGLDSEGHSRMEEVSDALSPAVAEVLCSVRLKEELMATSEELVNAQCQAVVEAKPISATEASAISTSSERTPNESDSLRKYTLEKRYLAPLTPEVARLDYGTDTWHQQLKLHYLMSVGNAYLSHSVEHSIKPLVTSSGHAFSFDVTGANRVELRAQLLNELGVSRLLDTEETFTQHHLVVREIASAVSEQASYVRFVFNWAKVPTSPMALVNKFMRELGLTLTKQPLKVRVGSNVVPAYKYDGDTDGREDVFRRWLARDTATDTQCDSNHKNVAISPYKNRERTNICNTPPSDPWADIPDQWTPQQPKGTWKERKG